MPELSDVPFLNFLALRQDSSFGPKLHTGEALLIIGTPAAAIQLTQKEPHPCAITGVAGTDPADPGRRDRLPRR